MQDGGVSEVDLRKALTDLEVEEHILIKKMRHNLDQQYQIKREIERRESNAKQTSTTS